MNELVDNMSSLEAEEIDDSVIAEGGLGEGSTNDYDRVWDMLVVARDAQTNIQALVVDAVRGGLVVDLGMRGFIPKSHIATQDLNHLDRYIGETLEVKVVEADEETGRVVLSERKVAEEKRRAQRAETLASLERGQVLSGTVRRLTNFGAFVDIGGIDGLLHISDMDWDRVEKPEDVVEVNQELQVLVLRIEEGGKKISLGLKQLTDDPWQEARRQFREGDLVDVTIERIEPYGAVINVMKGVQGLIPTDEMPRRRGEESGEEVQAGQTVNVKVLEFDQRGRRIIFSLKQAARAREKNEVRDYMKRQREELATPTLGDLFGDVFSKLQKKD